MKEIILIRHAKSSWEFNVPDEQRPLKDRGINDIKLVAKEFAKNNEVPNHVFSSPANRALSTCKLFMDVCGISQERIQVKDQLYDFSGEQVLNFIKQLPNDYESAMLFGHNHAFTSLANMLGNEYIGNLPTIGLVKLTFNVDEWENITKGTTEFVIIPKPLRGY